MAFNGILAFLLIVRENTENLKFSKWFRKNTQVASLFVFASGADIQILQVLASEYGGLESFSAPLSQTAENVMFWVSLASFVIEDIPQFIIQVFKIRHLI